MTSEEIYSNIKQLTGIPQNHRLVSMAYGRDPDPDSDNMLNECPIFMAFKDEYPVTLAQGTFDQFVEKNEFEKIVFNPYAIPLGVLIWMHTQPEHQNTKNMLYSNFNWLDCPTDIYGLWTAINSDPNLYVKKYLEKHPYVRSHNSGRPFVRTQRPTRTTNTARFDISISDREYGRCNYSVYREWHRLDFTDDVIDEVCDAEDDDQAKRILEEYIMDHYYNEDADNYEDYEYDDHDAEDHEDYRDDTDYDELLEEIRAHRR